MSSGTMPASTGSDSSMPARVVSFQPAPTLMPNSSGSSSLPKSMATDSSRYGSSPMAGPTTPMSTVGSSNSTVSDSVSTKASIRLYTLSGSTSSRVNSVRVKPSHSPEKLSIGTSNSTGMPNTRPWILGWVNA